MRLNSVEKPRPKALLVILLGLFGLAAAPLGLFAQVPQYPRRPPSANPSTGSPVGPASRAGTGAGAARLAAPTYTGQPRPPSRVVPVSGEEPAAVERQPAAAPDREEPRAQPAPKAEKPGTVQRAAGIVESPEHPLRPALKLAYESLELADRTIKDYSCTLVKRERIDGQLGDPEYIFMKIRHEPFSVYSYYLQPEAMRGQEAIYVAGKNDGKLVAHGTGLQSVIGTISLDPMGSLAMKGQRYPITQAGFKNLIKKMIELGEKESQFGECEVKFFKGAKIESRPATMIEIQHPNPRRNFRFALCRIFIDDEWKVPVRFEGYDWPAKAGDPPVLAEEYTYLKLQLNRGYTDADFDTRNKKYGF